MLRVSAREDRIVGTEFLVSLLYCEPEEIEICICLKEEDAVVCVPPHCTLTCTHKVSSRYLQASSNNIESLLICLCYCLKKMLEEFCSAADSIPLRAFGFLR